jgi:hypothetical protein
LSNFDINHCMPNHLLLQWPGSLNQWLWPDFVIFY